MVGPVSNIGFRSDRHGLRMTTHDSSHKAADAIATPKSLWVDLLIILLEIAAIFAIAVLIGGWLFGVWS